MGICGSVPDARKATRGVHLSSAGVVACGAMDIGVPKEIKAEEKRVAITPAGAAALVAHGHRVFVERGAGEGSGLADARYADAGARLCADADETWQRSTLILKVKEPVDAEIARLRPDLILFTYLHLAANEPLTRA